jgi:Ca2+-binding EF-hand superfamily protein
MIAFRRQEWWLSPALLASLLATASIARSAETSARPDPGSAEDVQDVLFFSDSRPMLIRLHILVDGKPYATRWIEYLTRWFRFLDRNADGFLDGEEAGRAPSVGALQQLLTNAYTFPPGNSPSLENLDWDHDNKVSLPEFLRYYRHTSAGPIQLGPPFNQLVPGVAQDTLTQRMYKLLDTDEDGKLSRAELEAAENTLLRYDQDDDELVTIPEISAGLVPATTQGRRSMVPAMQAPVVPLMLMPREDAPRRVSARLRVAKDVIARGDKNKNGSLSRDEIGMSREQFDSLDADKSGELDAIELLRWVIVAPDAEVVLRLGRVDDDRAALELIGKANLSVACESGRTLALSTEDSRVNLVAAAAVPVPPAMSIRQVLVQQFKTIDLKNKGYLTSQQLAAPQFTYLRSILPVVDRDEDDCLSLEELEAWMDLTASGMHCQTTVALAASGRGLFQVLDANQDGRLSLRELRRAPARLAPLDRDRDGSVSRQEIPLQYRIVVNPGPANYLAGQLGTTRALATPPPPTVSHRSPRWFDKMDRNGDGDISRSEFLGSGEDFRRLDTDGDGLISLEEALRADRLLRKR